MANHKSAVKQARRNEARRLRNRFWRSRMRTQVKKLRAALSAGDKKSAESLMPETLGLVDRTARAGVIHDRTASRYKSRLQHAFNKLAG
ncbi:MAG: 30S ribosomal protein S20 [Acidobacteriota bacterium]|nr:30S ribosomal protein S20 [Acidobacteriota bacterium]